MSRLKTLTPRQFLDHVIHLCHENLNNDALIATAEFFEQRDLVEVFEGYLYEQAHLGYMSDDAIHRRNTDKHRLLDSILLTHDEHTYKLYKSVL